MQITINGETCEILQTESLQAVLEKQLDDLRGIAVAINNTVVRKAAWPDTPLHEADKVLVITAAKGG